LATLGLGLPLLGALPFVPAAYHLLSLLSQAQATPGQQLCGLVVVRDADMGRPALWQAAAAVAGYYLTLATGGLLLAVAPFVRRKRTLHDLASGLTVVRAEALDYLRESRFVG
jgi:uncharacterized RDD family membrane protein YckC